jgi:uncharacterized membrane protein
MIKFIYALLCGMSAGVIVYLFFYTVLFAASPTYWGLTIISIFWLNVVTILSLTAVAVYTLWVYRRVDAVSFISPMAA